jgi:hypothetical protein
MNRITLKILKSDLKKDDTSHFFLHPRFRTPYSMILHDYVITLSLTDNHNIFINSNLYGLREEILDGEVTKVNTKEVLNQLSRDKILETNTNVANDIAKRRIKLFEGTLDKLHKKLGGKGSKMYPELKQLIFLKLSEENSNNSKLLDIEDLTKIIFSVFVEQGLVQN